MNESNRHAVVASTVFDGEECRRDYAVVIEGTKIATLLPRRRTAAGDPSHRLARGRMARPWLHRLPS